MSIPASEITQIQQDALIALDKTCTIQRKTKTSDGFGSSSETWATVATTTAGMTQPSASLLQNYAYAIANLATYQVRLPTGTDVQALDHLLIEGKTLEVHIVLTPQSYSIYTNCLAARLTP